MENKTNKAQEVENYEERADFKREEAEGSAHEGAQYPSRKDVLVSRGYTPDETETPDKDEEASDVETPANDLHGSLHGRWNVTGDKQ